MNFKTIGFFGQVCCTMVLAFRGYELKADVVIISPGSAITLNPAGEVTVQCSKPTSTPPPSLTSGCVPCIYDERQATNDNFHWYVRYCYKANASSGSQSEKICGRWVLGEHATADAAYSKAKVYCESYLREDPRCK